MKTVQLFKLKDEVSKLTIAEAGIILEYMEPTQPLQNVMEENSKERFEEAIEYCRIWKFRVGIRINKVIQIASGHTPPKK